MRFPRICTFLAALTVGASLALADGGLMVKLGRSESLAASPKQEALLLFNGKQVQVTLRTHYRAGPKELAWVVPVPKKPTRVEKADDDIFEALADETTPEFTFIEPKPACSIACGGGASTVSGRVTVTETGTAGIFDYTVLEATDADALTQWLQERDYVIPEAGPRVFKYYVDADWHWLAIRVRSEESEKPTLALHPIRYTYPNASLVYPMIISSLSADEENEIVLYVVAQGRFQAANWANAEIEEEDLRLDDDTPSGTNYEELFRHAGQKDKGHTFVTEFSHFTDNVHHRPLLPTLIGQDPESFFSTEALDKDVYLTRLRAVITPEAMDRDVALIRCYKDEWVSRHFTLWASHNPGAATGALTTVAVFVVCGWGLRRFTRRRRDGVDC